MDNYHTMKTRLNYCGGLTQQERMIADKKASLDYAIMHSYQGAQVYANGETALALINPNTVKQDYDDKIISIGKEHNYKVGTIFEWVHKDPNKNTKWLIYLQDLTELAYFKGNIRKCNYEIKWEVKNEQGEKTEQSTYVALTGPSEGQLNSATASGISIDSPNYTLHFYMPNNEATASYFDRYSKFYLLAG